MRRAILMLFMAAAPALADDEILFSDGGWETILIDYSDGNFGCSTQTTNGDGTTFFYESWPGGGAAVSLSDDDWQFPAESVPETFGIRVNGGDLWTAEGTKFGHTAQADALMDDTAFNAFFEQLMNGTSMVIESAKGTEITRFSLNGAAATLEYHFECEARLAAM